MSQDRTTTGHAGGSSPLGEQGPAQDPGDTAGGTGHDAPTAALPTGPAPERAGEPTAAREQTSPASTWPGASGSAPAGAGSTQAPEHEPHGALSAHGGDGHDGTATAGAGTAGTGTAGTVTPDSTAPAATRGPAPVPVPHGLPRTGPGARPDERAAVDAGAVPGEPVRAVPRPPAGSSPARSTTRRRARLAVKRVDPWSVFVLSLIVSCFLGVVLVVAVFVLYSLLSSLGVLDSLDTFAQELDLIDPGASLISAGKALGVATVVALVDVVLLTVLATLSAFLYNLCASLTGGLEVTLAGNE